MTRAETPAAILPAVFRAAYGQIAMACIVSLINGVASTAIVVLINRALNTSGATPTRSVVIFAVMALATCATQSIARVMFSNLGQRSLASMRRVIAARVQATSCVHLEAVGNLRIQSLVTDDAEKIANLLVYLPFLITHAVLVSAMLIYLAYLSVPFFLSSLVVIVLGSGAHLLFQRQVSNHLTKARQAQDSLFGYFSALALGAKELRLNRDKAHRFLDVILSAAIETFAHHRSRGLALMAVAGGWGTFLFYALLGTTVYWPSFASRDPAVTSGYVVAFFYIIGPLETLLNMMPFVNLARVAARRIDTTFAELAVEPVGPYGRTSDTATIALAGAMRRTHDERTGESFDLGPLDLVLLPGQITFLIGGNGSGKTTLAKVVAGLYVPDDGKLALNGTLIDHIGRSVYRQHISAIFSDYYLFETLLESPDPGLHALAQDWLKRLDLDHRVRMEDGSFSTQNLSTGQRKRLALIVACLENRPVMIFDEWAADQDPIFRKIFYETILPDLRARGKTLLVVTHDDRYFGQSDQLVKLDRGIIVEHRGGYARIDGEDGNPNPIVA